MEIDTSIEDSLVEDDLEDDIETFEYANTVDLFEAIVYAAKCIGKSKYVMLYPTIGTAC